MADLTTIKNWFKTGLKPTQTQFWAWMDSFWHKDEQIPQSAVQNLIATLNAKAEASQFNGHKTDPNAHSDLFALKEDKIQKGVPNGYAPLNEFGKILSDYLVIVDDLITGGERNMLSAKQGLVLKSLISDLKKLSGFEDLVLDVTSGKLLNPQIKDTYFFGQETLQHWFSLFKENSNQNVGNLNGGKIVCTGDSTTYGVGGTYGAVPAILAEQALIRGFNNVKVVNRGVSGEPLTDWMQTSKTTSWQSTYLALDIAENPDLLIVRWGANDPFYNVSPLGDSNGVPVNDRDYVLEKVVYAYRETLATLRATPGMDVANLSILLVTPGPMNDVHFGRDEIYFNLLAREMKQIALDFQCAYLDAYSIFNNSWGGVGTWMDSDNTSGTARAIHPQDELYELIANEIANVCMPENSLAFKSNAFRNSSAVSVNRDFSDGVNSYYSGLNFDRIAEGIGNELGTPYDGIAYTSKQADGASLQFITPVLGVTQGQGLTARFGWGATWQAYLLGGSYELSSLTYQNGYSNFGSGYENGRFKKSLDGMVFLSGTISPGIITDGTLLFTLPVEFRPAEICFLQVSSENGNCLIEVKIDGKVSLYRFGAGGSYLILNGACFQAYK